MSNAIMPLNEWDNIVNAVRAKTGKTEPLLCTQVASEIESIPTGGSGGNSLNDYLNGRKTDITAEDLEGVPNIPSYCFHSRPITSIEIPNGIEIIGEYAFAYCDSLTDVTLPNSVTDIGQGAFMSCAAFTSIAIPDSVTSIGGNVFNGCISLTDVTLPDGVTSIGERAFQNCVALSSIEMGNGITSIGDNAFYQCKKLKKVYLKDIAKYCAISFVSSSSSPFVTGASLYINNELITQLVIPDGVTKINYCAFFGCSSITDVVIPDSVTDIASWVFSSCSSLLSIVIPDGVQNIGRNTCYKCVKLASATIGKGVTNIELNAFTDCTSLMKVTCLAENPPTIHATALNGVPTDCVIKVPAASVEAYKSAPNWIARADYITAIEE